MSEQSHQCTAGAYQHEKGKYKILNAKNQTPKKFVLGQRYKLGTGVILVQSGPDKSEKVIVSKKGYKQFISQIFSDDIGVGKIVAFKWLPKKIIYESTIHSQKCGQDCVRGHGCVRPGCICSETEEVCR